MICSRETYERCVKSGENIHQYVYHESGETKAEGIAVDLVLTAWKSRTYLIMMFEDWTPFKYELIDLFRKNEYKIFNGGSGSGNINGF